MDMMASLIKKFLRDRKAATAVALAIMTVPMLIGASAAVDFSRLASARTLLQASVDSAAVAGAGAWQMSESSTNASNVTLAAYNGTSAQLKNFVTTSTPTIGMDCNGTTGASGQTTNQCGGTAAFSTATGAFGCPTAKEYCVVVTATATMKNSLFAFLIPSEMLSVKSTATTAFPPDTISGKNIPPSPGFGNAADLSGIYAYAVPMDAPGNTADFGEVPTPNSNCSSVQGPIQFEHMVAPASGVTACNFLFVAVSTTNGTGGTGGSITLAQGQPIAFTFVNDTGESSAYGLDDTYQYTNNITVNGTGEPNGDIVAGDAICTQTGKHGTCTQTTPSTVALYGECPQHTLYGSFSQGVQSGSLTDTVNDINDANDTTQVTLSQPSASDNGAANDATAVGTSDSLNVYSSAFELLGFPTTHTTNHSLPQFTSTVQEKLGGTTYTVAVQCPQWPTTTSATPAGPQNTHINSYATYYPDTTFTDGTSTDIYPPQITACAPVESATSTNATPSASSSNPWWGWSNSNFGSSDCAAAQTASFSNCALLVQPLGTNVPVDSNNQALLPDYYNLIETNGTIEAMDPVYDAVKYIDPISNLTVDNTRVAAGTTPSRTSSTGITASTFGGLFVGSQLVTEPVSNGDHSPPVATSFQCYNPQANGINGATLTAAGVTNNDTSPATPVDPVANPQLGAVVCDQDPPQTYGLYWNDMGSSAADDLGYWNAIEGFTCSVPSITNAGGGPSTLSG
jgi:Flp pilus assembly protein TadG